MSPPQLVSAPFSCTVSLSGTGNSFGFLTKIDAAGRSAEWTLCFPGEPGGLVALPSGSLYFAVNREQRSTVFRIDAAAQPAPASVAAIEPAYVRSLAVDRKGSVYIGGAALAALQTTPQAYQRILAGACSDLVGHECPNGFAAKLDAAGRIEWSTFTGSGPVSMLAPDSRGALWITGALAVTGGWAGFIGKFDADGAKRTFFESFGGGSANVTGAWNTGLGIAIGKDDSAYIAGRYASGLQRRPGPIIRFDYTSGDNWLKKLAPDGRTLWTSAEPFRGLGAFSMPVAVGGRDGNLYAGAAGVLWVVSSESGTVVSSRRTPMPIKELAIDPRDRIFVCGGGNYGAFVGTPGAWITQYPGGHWSGYVARFDPSHAASFVVTSVVNAASYDRGLDYERASWRTLTAQSHQANS